MNDIGTAKDLLNKATKAISYASDDDTRLRQELSALKKTLSEYPKATITYATIDSEVARKLGIEKGKTYTIALLGEAGVRSDG